MVPDYDDDDIIEDYDEVTDNASARRVNSGQGGPVRRPSDSVRPSRSAAPGGADGADEFAGPPKGKITQKSAKLIWAVCILVVVLGVGAVVVDYVWDPLGRHQAKGGAANNAGTAQTNRTPPPRKSKSPEEILQDEFITAVSRKMSQMNASKAWDFYWTAQLEFEYVYEQMKKARNDENATEEQRAEAYANAIKHYYKAKYAAVLFMHQYDKDNISLDYMAIDMRGDEVKGVRKEHLQDPRVRDYQAAFSKTSGTGTEVNQFRTDIISKDIRAIGVHESEEWRANVFGEWEQRWRDATSNKPPVFNQEDLDFVTGPDYEAGEKKRWEKFREEHSLD